ncbi:MAG TPA: nuclear transport factor 2 family protein [Candidatus Angelobacter sp.]|nr:nuclear transport factor 2 family protein [Candidatus Angelobacter sp.]
MGHPSHRRALHFLFWFLLFFALSAPLASFAQELPLEHCDALPLLEVKVAGHSRWFLVDTAATSMLNLESFAEGWPHDVSVTSWSGTLATTAKEVTIEGLEVGHTKVVKLTLPAIDLSAIGKACGRKLDGILGADLLRKLGATVDLNRQILHVTTADEAHEAELVSEMQRDMMRCGKAFNASDESAFAECLDPKIVFFTAREELYGREKVAGYFRERYFQQAFPAHLEIQESAFHVVGETVWYEYAFTIDTASGRLRGRGMAMCKKTDGHWRMASMHHSDVQFEPVVAAGASR